MSRPKAGSPAVDGEFPPGPAASATIRCNPDLAAIETVILCGGKGLRLGGAAGDLPKPLVSIGGRPLLIHVMKIYSSFGCRDFLLCLGYRAGAIVDTLRDGRLDPNWRVRFLDTGPETPTGGRLKRIEPEIAGDDFFCTYADGVADVNLATLSRFHQEHGRIATVTAVRPILPFGLLNLGYDDSVLGFEEKPVLDRWINGGFFAFNRRIFDVLTDNSILEVDGLPGLAARDELRAFRHTGFWRCLDTPKDAADLNRLWGLRQAWKEAVVSVATGMKDLDPLTPSRLRWASGAIGAY